MKQYIVELEGGVKVEFKAMNDDIAQNTAHYMTGGRKILKIWTMPVAPSNVIYVDFKNKKRMYI